MKRIAQVTILLSLVGCAHLGGNTGGGAAARMQLWHDAHGALGAVQFARADTLFSRLARDYAATETGRESLFYLGALRLDPRNPDWDPQRSETALNQYLAIDTSATVKIHRRPEGETLQQIARQLNLPAEDRIEGLQPETREVTRTRTVPRRVVVRGREAAGLAAEVQRLRRQLAERESQIGERDAQIRKQGEELDRIRKTLTGTRR